MLKTTSKSHWRSEMYKKKDNSTVKMNWHSDMTYSEFLKKKEVIIADSGFEVSDDELRYQIINIEGKVYDLSGILHSPFLEDGETVDSAYYEYRSIGNGGKFYLKDGQIARFPFIPIGRSYEIKESDSERFLQVQPQTGTYYSGNYDGTGIRREFINEYTPRSDPNTLTVKKRVSAPIGYEYDGDMDFAFRIKVNS